MSQRMIVLTAGGTGGHLFPAEALASELLARGFAVSLITDTRGQAFGGRMADVAVHRIQAAAVLGKGLGGRIRALWLIGVGTLQSISLLRRLKPRVVVGFGGYPSVPALLAARRLKTIIHEQNAVMGRANRLAAGKARAIAVSFPETRAIHPMDQDRVVFTGNPVRPTLMSLAERAYEAPVADGRLELLVTGGSQGARVFGEIVPAAIASLPAEMRSRLRVAQQCRAEDLDRVRAAYNEAAVEAELAGFFADMPERLGRAHLAICRAGASTIAELTLAGRPAILVPLPGAADDHQTYNARHVAHVGGAWLMPQTEFTPSALARRLFELLRNPERLTDAALAARSVAEPAAAKRLADLVASVGDAA